MIQPKHGKITQDKISKAEQQLNATGVKYELVTTIEVKDANLGKKASQTVKDKIGENSSYEIQDTQIKKSLASSGVYNCKEGDRINIKAEAQSDSMAQVLSNSLLKVMGSDVPDKSVESSSLIYKNGE